MLLLANKNRQQITHSTESESRWINLNSYFCDKNYSRPFWNKAKKATQSHKIISIAMYVIIYMCHLVRFTYSNWHFCKILNSKSAQILFYVIPKVWVILQLVSGEFFLESLVILYIKRLFSQFGYNSGRKACKRHTMTSNTVKMCRLKSKQGSLNFWSVPKITIYHNFRGWISLKQ